mmetsp:Transcript_4545/g.12430  ORF Transcript_4545/g.12430 Transcript_4545/m.12430 type:complete len:122 (-) Transcript_4545:872-1237(-)
MTSIHSVFSKQATPLSRARPAPSSPRLAVMTQRLPVVHHQHRNINFVCHAEPEAKNGEADAKRTLSREAEPDQYWSPPGERKGANPMKDPLAIIGVVAILFPFLILGIAIATGVIDTSVYQ